MKIFTAALASTAMAVSMPAVAQEEAEEVTYQEVLACAALSAVFAASLEDEPEEKAYHDEQGQRLLVMAMDRDGAEGETASAEFEPTVTKLVEKIESFGEDEAAIEAFLSEGAEACGGFISENQEEFDAVVLDEAEADAIEETPPSSDIVR